MAAVANGNAPSVGNSAGGLSFKFLAHVQSLPLINDSLDQLYSYPLGRNAGETIKAASQTAFKLSGPINPLLKKADAYADNGLTNIESRFPLVKAPTSEIKEKTSGAAKTTVDTYVGAIHNKFGQTKQNGYAAAEELKSHTNGAKNSIQGSLDPVLKPVLDQVENILDTYLPKAKAKAKEVEKEVDGKVPETKKEAEYQVKRVFDISGSMLDRSTNAAIGSVHYGVGTLASLTSFVAQKVQWSLQNPAKVPEAALSSVHVSSASIREKVDGTVEISRNTAHTLTDLAFQARDTALQVFEKEQKAAPKDQPRGLFITAINTALVLTGKSLDQAKVYLQKSNTSKDVRSKVDDVGNRISDTTEDVSSKVQDSLPEENDVKKSATKGKEYTHKTAKQASQSIEEILNKEHK